MGLRHDVCQRRSAVAAVACASGIRSGLPEQPITLVIPFSVGGPDDVIARLLRQASSLGNEVDGSPRSLIRRTDIDVSEARVGGDV